MIPEDVQKISTYASAKENARLQQALDKASQRITLVMLGSMGGLLGLALGAAGGLRYRSLKRAVMGAVAGACMGALGAVLGGLLANLSGALVKSAGETDSLLATSVTQMTVLGLLGAGIGIGMGAAVASKPSLGESTLFGFLAGVLAGLLFPITTAVAFPMAVTDDLVPLDPIAQLVWVLLTALLLGLLLPMAGSKRQKSTAVSTVLNESTPGQSTTDNPPPSESPAEGA